MLSYHRKMLTTLFLNCFEFQKIRYSKKIFLTLIFSSASFLKKGALNDLFYMYIFVCPELLLVFSIFSFLAFSVRRAIEKHSCSSRKLKKEDNGAPEGKSKVCLIYERKLDCFFFLHFSLFLPFQKCCSNTWRGPKWIPQTWDSHRPIEVSLVLTECWKRSPK